MTRSAKTTGLLLLIVTCFLSAPPARCEPAGLLKRTCSEIVESLRAHEWQESYRESVPFPFQMISTLKSDGVNVESYVIDRKVARLEIGVPRELVKPDWKAFYKKLGLPESTPEPQFGSRSEDIAIQSDGGNWVLLIAGSDTLSVQMGSKEFFASMEDFKENRIKPELIEAKRKKLLQNLLNE